MSYSSAYSLDYQTTPEYSNGFLIPFLTNSSTSQILPSNSGTLTSGLNFSCGSTQFDSGIYALRFVGTLSASDNNVVITRANAVIVPSSGFGGIVTATQSIITPPDGGFTCAASTNYNFALTEVCQIIAGDDNNPTQFYVNVAWTVTSGTPTVSLENVGLSYVKIT
jgi:hypothetical protein